MLDDDNIAGLGGGIVRQAIDNILEYSRNRREYIIGQAKGKRARAVACWVGRIVNILTSQDPLFDLVRKRWVLSGPGRCSIRTRGGQRAVGVSRSPSGGRGRERDIVPRGGCRRWLEGAQQTFLQAAYAVRNQSPYRPPKVGVRLGGRRARRRCTR